MEGNEDRKRQDEKKEQAKRRNKRLRDKRTSEQCDSARTANSSQKKAKYANWNKTDEGPVLRLRQDVQNHEKGRLSLYSITFVGQIEVARAYKMSM